MRRSQPAQPILDAASLRRAFDTSFQTKPGELEEHEVLLAVRAGELRCALPLVTLGGVRRRPRVTPVPSDDPALAGLGAFRGEAVPLYRLSTLIGASAASDEEEVAWAAFDRSGSIGLIFQALEGHVRVAPEGFAALPEAAPDAPCRRVARVGSEQWLVVDLASLLAPVTREEGGA